MDILDFNGDFFGSDKKVLKLFLLWVNIATGWGHLHASCSSFTNISFEKRFVFIQTVEVVSIDKLGFLENMISLFIGSGNKDEMLLRRCY